MQGEERPTYPTYAVDFGEPFGVLEVHLEQRPDGRFRCSIDLEGVRWVGEGQDEEAAERRLVDRVRSGSPELGDDWGSLPEGGNE